MGVMKFFAEIPAEIKNKFPTPGNTAGVQENIINYILYAVGVAAIVMMIVAGIQMTTSAGDPGAVKKAKMTLTYAIIGLVVAILAYAIVNFVVRKVS